MKKVIFIVCVLNMFVLHAQERSDSTLSFEYSKKGWSLMQSNLDSTIYYARQAQVFGKGCVSCISFSSNTLGTAYAYKGAMDSAIFYIGQALAYDESLENEKGIATNYNALASVYYYQSEYDSALVYYQKYYHYSEQDTLGRLTAIGNIGSVYSMMFNYVDALNIYTEGLRLIGDNVSAKWQYQKAVLYNNIGVVYAEVAAYEKALPFFKQGLACLEGLEPQMIKINLLTNIAKHHSEIEKYEQAKDLYEQALEVSNQIGASSSILLGKIGADYYYAGQIDSAYTFLHRALEGLEKEGRTSGVVEAKLILGKCNVAKHKYEEAEKILLEALKEVEFTLHYEAEKSILNELIQLYFERGDFQEGGKYYLDFVNSSDSLFEQNDRLLNMQMGARLALAENERKLQLSKLELDLLTEKSKRRSLIFGFIVLLVLLAGYFLILRMRWLKRINKMQADEVRLKQNKISELATRIISKNRYIERLNKMVNSIKGKDADVLKAKASIKKALSDNEWLSIVADFNALHHGLLDSIEAKGIKLTKVERKLIVMLKLSMSSKEIAEVMQVKPSSVMTLRYRLRKKMGIASDEKLKEYLK